MRVLTKDNEHARAIVREMEKRGYTLDSVNTSGAFDITASEFFKDIKRERRARRLRALWRAVGFFLTLAIVWYLT